MGANRRFDTLGDYVHADCNVEVSCYCGHKGVIDARKLSRWAFCHRWSEVIASLASHLYCSRCRGRWINLRPTKAKPDRPDWMPYEEDWKRLIRRLRS